MKSSSLSEYLSQTAPGALTIGGARMAFMDIESGFWSLRRQTETLLGAKTASELFQQAGANGGASYAAAQGSSDEPQVQGKLFEQCLQAYQTAGVAKIF
ncbi:MAG: hypothetical protein Fur0016_17250 [Anaerolineales bacterium]